MIIQPYNHTRKMTMRIMRRQIQAIHLTIEFKSWLITSYLNFTLASIRENDLLNTVYILYIAIIPIFFTYKPDVLEQLKMAYRTKVILSVTLIVSKSKQHRSSWRTLTRNKGVMIFCIILAMFVTMTTVLNNCSDLG
jgi:hypothetical protein